MLYPTVLLSMFLITGCSQINLPPVSEEALFCQVEEKRLFTQEELEWRAANAPWNLRRDFKTNKTWDRECGEDKSSPELNEE